MIIVLFVVVFVVTAFQIGLFDDMIARRMEINRVRQAWEEKEENE